MGQQGATVSRLTIGARRIQPVKAILNAIDDVNVAIFPARAGDQGLFQPQYEGQRYVTSYALYPRMLRNSHGTLDQRTMLKLKDAVDAVTRRAGNMRVAFPLGTYFEGTPGAGQTEGSYMAVNRYPMGAAKLKPDVHFVGKAKLTRYLTPIDSKVHQPANVTLQQPIIAHIRGGCITRFESPESVVRAVHAHYDHVATLIDPDDYNIDSGYAGSHPLTGYDSPSASNPLCWARTVFANPRVLHFGTCGMRPPSEVCWMILNPTITIAGVTPGENGRLHPERHELTGAVQRTSPDLASAAATPAGRIGIDGAA